MRQGALTFVVLAATAAIFPASASAFPSTLLSGVAPGQTWVVCQGYNGAISHSGNLRYSLDLTADLSGVGRTGCWGSATTTGERAVVAPGNGTVAWNNGSGFCVNFDAGDSMKLYHVTGPRTNTRVTAGQVVGKVYRAGLAANGGYAHLHIAAYRGRGCVRGNQVPFSGSARLACGAPSMSANGSANQWSGTRLALCDPSTAGRDPRGRLESASAPAAGQVRVRGWTFDPDSPKAVNSVQVHIGGKNHKSAAAKGKRGDVARVHKAAGPNHGFDVTVSTKLRGGQKVCVYAINLAKSGGRNALLGCRKVTVEAPPPTTPTSPPPGSSPAPPKGRVDAVSSPAVGKVRVRGWSFDPNAPADPVAVHVYVGGKNHKIATANLERDDVADAYRGAEDPGPNHGFDVTFSTALKGAQEVCVYAIDIGSGPNPKLGCKKVTIAAPPPPPPTVTLSKGGSAQGKPGCKSSYCRYMVVNFKNFSSGTHSITCRASNGSEGGYFTYTRSGSSGSSAVCYYGFPGHKVWVTVDGVSSNRVTW